MQGKRVCFKPLMNAAYALLAAFAAMAPAASDGADVFVECESFDNLGGWVIDAYSMRAMGSSYVMAHGCGRPVADAVGRIAVPEKGRYSVWARTRNWNAEWTKGAAGLFKVRIGGVEMPQALGTGDAAWHWRKAGEVDLSPGPAEVALHDLTGFNGRCDALFLTTRTLDPRSAEVAAESARTVQRGKVAEDREEWDMVVVGGGVAGCCAALSASRYKLKTLLLQDRGVLGGCNSSEIRVSAGGYMHKGPYPALGNVLEEILPVRGDYLPLSAKFYEDDRKAKAFSYPEMTARLKLNKYVYAVETNSEGRVTAVISRDTRTGRDMRHRARWFTDATGDGVVARMAGCATMYGREARSRWNEACAPVKADRQVMGHTIQWLTRTENRPVEFPDIDWGLPFTEETVRYVRRGSWWQEAGQYRDMADETEAIRDYGLLAIFSNWSFLKNHSARRKDWSRLAFDWISPIGGKRESHRVVGDYVLTETDLESQRKFEDGTAVVTWDIDFHFPDPDNAKRFKEPFRSCAYHRGFGPPVAVPYRCLYAKDAPNIFLAGRDISTSHGAFAAVRVQRTLGMLGEVVGIAAGICREKSCDPRDVYRKHLPLLKERMTKGVPKFPQYCAFGGGMHEKYHFADLGFISIWPNPVTNLSPRVVEAIRSLGMNHRHRHPQIDGEPDRRTHRRRFVLADESRARLHYWDSADPSASFSIPGERPMWDLKKVGAMRYRTVVKNGFLVFDLVRRKVVDSFRHPALDVVTAVCEMPDGGFVASVNPQKGPDRNRVVLLHRFSAARELVATYRCEGLFRARSMQRDLDGKTFLLAWEKGFARIRLPEKGSVCEIVSDFRQPKGRNLFDVVPLHDGGYLAGCGYGGGLVRFGADGKSESVWFVPETNGCRSMFYAQPKPMPDGHVYIAHWTGHGADDSAKGWQVAEFDREGKVVWHLHDPVRFGSVSGIDVIQGTELFVECESFEKLGGWVVDPHSMKALESSYVMAHGIGKPVADAETVLAVPSAGRYAVWAKTRDWADEWREGRGSAPGRFKVVVNGSELAETLGTEGRDWHWQKAGEVDLQAGAVKVALRDLTGFNARCDALFFTDDPAAKPPFKRSPASVADNGKAYDLVIVGGGMAGICMAQTAVRYGVKTLLLQNRDVLGGCNSSEVRVGLGGVWHLPPYPNLGRVLDELAPAFNNNRPLPPEFYEDARKANFFVRTEGMCDVFYREHVFAIETDPSDPKRIRAVLSRNTHTGAVTRHRGTLFADATGDAVIARLAGCETMYGREARSRFNESCAPEKASRQVMGHSTQWTSRVADSPVSFPDIDWGFVLGESNVYHITEGGWEQEAGQYRDMADDTEAIRDYGLYAVFSNWSYLKNRSPRKGEWANREITWISPIGGKRESYRVVGDHVLTQNDIENHVPYPDLTAPMNWNIDLHFPDPENEAKFKEPFRSCAYHRHYNGPYAIPYRCLYARDCSNLFLAGRDISCSHVAFAATRVMGTLGVCGEVAGMAAAVCKKNGCTPREVYTEHFGELKRMMEQGAPRLQHYHGGGCGGLHEYYHFKSDDRHERPSIHPNRGPLTPEQERKIRALGIKHRTEHPQLEQTAQ